MMTLSTRCAILGVCSLVTHAEPSVRSKGHSPFIHETKIAQQPGWTAEMVRALPDDGKRYEVLDGELHVTATPSPPHQRVAGNLLYAIHRYLEEHGIGDAPFSPSDLEFSPQRMLQPDVFAYPLVAGRRPQAWRDIMPLLLAIEVTTPATAYVDHQIKRRIYQSERVPEYWIVDVNARIVERWRPDDDRPEVITEVLEWQPRPDVPPVRMPLEDVFEEMFGPVEN